MLINKNINKINYITQDKEVVDEKGPHTKPHKLREGLGGGLANSET